MKLGILTALMAAGFSLAAHAQKELPAPTFTPGSGVEMRVTNLYETLPPSGFLPLRVEVRNGTSKDHTWGLTTTHAQGDYRTFDYSVDLEVPAESERVFELLVPLSPEPRDGSRFSNLRIRVSGDFVESAMTNENVSVSGKKLTGFVGMGKALSVKNWGPLREKLDKELSHTLDGTPLSTDHMPSDWRALAGFDMIFFTAEEWRAIAAAQREALQDWVAQGGRLTLCLPDAGATAGLPPARDLGYGTITHIVLGENVADTIAQILLKPMGTVADDTFSNYRMSDWRLAEKLGNIQPPQFFIIAFVVCFGLAVGPLNFFLFARSENRHRLFWTTPLISLVASLLMIGYISIREGLGGEGGRFDLLYSLPAENRVVLVQEQVSRTGVLWSNAFTLTEKCLLLPIAMQTSGSDTMFQASERGSRYALRGSTWSGDWFQSRMSQSQLLSSVMPTRGRVEITLSPGGQPVAVSSFERELTDFFYMDADSKVWKADKLRVGDKVTLSPANAGDLEQAGAVVQMDAGYRTRQLLGALVPKKMNGKFLAKIPSGYSLQTLGAIRWDHTPAVLIGEVLNK